MRIPDMGNSGDHPSQVDREAGQVLTEGKRVYIFEKKDDPTAVIEASDDDMSTRMETACNVFRFLRECHCHHLGIPLAFREQISDTAFIADKCEMAPFEVVVRRGAYGSYLKRHPHIKERQPFSKLKCEFFLKTRDQKFKDVLFPSDNPLLIKNDGGDRVSFSAYRSDTADLGYGSLGVFDEHAFGKGVHFVFEMEDIARKIFLVLEKAWGLRGGKLAGLKLRFGFNHKGKLILAGIIDNDSWHVFFDDARNGMQSGKNEALRTPTEEYARVERLTSSFTLPRQQLVVWAGLAKDDIGEFKSAFQAYRGGDCIMRHIVCSAHKEPVRAMRELAFVEQNVPDTVHIAYVGRSNGLGPTLAANTSRPVITVPADANKGKEDIWSSLNVPSDVPLMTVLRPKEALLAAIKILAMRNPRLYAIVQYEKEKRAENELF